MNFSRLLLLFMPIYAFAQSNSATFTGTAVDQTGAGVPNVAIAARNVNTGLERQITSGQAGFFTISLLPPGAYNITAAKPGFSTAELQNVVLRVGEQVSIEIVLRVAGSTETVTIVEQAGQVHTAPSVSTVIDRQFIEHLPMNGRSFQSLIILTPGVVLTKTDFGSQGQFSVNGQRSSSNYFMVDGVSANIHVSVSATLGQTAAGAIPGVSAAGGTSNLVSVDALQEFRIQTSTFAPEFGRTPGAQVSLVTRSGTNQFHGTLYEYFRNDVFDANDWFADSRGLKKAPIRQNNFGGVLGGPILRDRTFFFASYEGLRLRQPQTKITDVPSLSLRRTAPAQVQAFLNAYPIPNGPESTRGLAQYAASYSDPSVSDAGSLRGDHYIGSRLMLFGRYNHSPSELLIRAIDNTSVNTLTAQSFLTKTATAGATLVVSPRVLNEFRANWSRSRSSWFSHLDDFGGAAPPLPSAFLPPGVNPLTSLVVFGIGGNQSSFYVGRNVQNRMVQGNLIDNLSVTSGTHQIRFGTDYRRLWPVLGYRNYSQFVNFDGAAGLASGRTTTGFVEAVDPAPLLFQNFSLYGQDTWRASRKLTLTYGLRWDVNPAPSARNGKQLYRAVGLNDPPNLSVEPGAIYRTQYSAFAPRLGFALLLAGTSGRETVLRGGAGVFYDIGTSTAGNVASNFPQNARVNFSNLIYPVDPAVAAPPRLRRSLPVGAFGFRAFDPELALPRIYQWSFTLEQSLGTNQSISAGYVAAVGRRLLRLEFLPSPSPNFGGNVTITRNSATSDYHALQVQFTRRLDHGLQALASYTWSHSIDVASVDSASAVRGDALAASLDRASSDFDVRHAVTAAVTYNVPPSRLGTPLELIWNGWSVDSIFTARSSTPVSLITGASTLFGVSPRPNVVPGVPLYLNDPNAGGGVRYNRAAYAAPPAGVQGNLGRNTLDSFPAWQLDLSVRREIQLTERVGLQFRAEMFNVLNHPNFGDPVRTLNSGLFGLSDRMLARSLSPGGGAGFNPLYQIGGPRSIQLALRFQF